MLAHLKLITVLIFSVGLFMACGEKDDSLSWLKQDGDSSRTLPYTIACPEASDISVQFIPYSNKASYTAKSGETIFFGFDIGLPLDGMKYIGAQLVQNPTGKSMLACVYVNVGARLVLYTGDSKEFNECSFSEKETVKICEEPNTIDCQLLCPKNPVVEEE